MKNPIYLDYNSTSQPDPQVIESMLPFFKEDFGNPSNNLHSYGWSAENAVKKAAEKVAALINCEPLEIIWNAGATEGNNSVIFGLIRKLKLTNPTEKIHFITSEVEHWSVLNSFAAAEKFESISTTLLPVSTDGVVSLSELKKHIRPETKLVSLIWVNNEIGAVNPIDEIASYCNEHQIYFHTDATQAVGKIKVDLQKTPVHFLTFSSHKLYGPKGIGALYIRSKKPNVEIEPFIVGGGQQHNQRSGTLNVPAIVGTGTAAELCLQNMDKEFEKARKMSQFLYSELQKNLPHIQLNGPVLNERSPYNLSLRMPQMIDFVLPQLSELAFSKGSACQSGEASISHVLKAIGLNSTQAQSTIRLSIGRFTTEVEITRAAQIILNAFKI